MTTRRLHFHIRADDCFGTLATVLDLLRQDMDRHGTQKQHARMLGRLTDQLVYLQRNFRIERKEVSADGYTA